MILAIKGKNMNKLSLDALKEGAEIVTSNKLMSSISGGLENGCHTLATTNIDPKK